MTPEMEMLLTASVLVGLGYVVLALVGDRLRTPRAVSLAESAEHLARRRGR